MESASNNCRSCNNPILANFCSNCGQPVKLKRVNFHYISHEIQHLLHLEKGFLYTLKELIIRPGQNIKDFISDDRSRLVKPLIFLIISSLLYTSIIHFFHIEDGYVNYTSEKASATQTIFTWIKSHYGYGNIIMGIFIALWLKLLFRKHEYNVFEILILLCFVMGMFMVMAAVFALAESLLKIKIMAIGGFAGIVYSTWAIGQFFDKKKPISYVKGLVAYFLGMTTFFAIVLLIGSFIDFFNKA